MSFPQFRKAISLAKVVAISAGLATAGHAEWTPYTGQKASPAKSAAATVRLPAITSQHPLAGSPTKKFEASHTVRITPDPTTVQMEKPGQVTLADSSANEQKIPSRSESLLPLIIPQGSNSSSIAALHVQSTKIDPVRIKPVLVEVDSDQEEIDEDVDRLLNQDSDQQWVAAPKVETPATVAVNETQPTAPVSPNAEFFRDLQQLVGEAPPAEPVAVQQTALVSDVEDVTIRTLTEETEEPAFANTVSPSLSYLEDLHSLLGKTSPKTTTAQFVAQVETSPVPPQPADDYNPQSSDKPLDASDDICETDLSGLFGNLSEITLAGPSTTPPEEELREPTLDSRAQVCFKDWESAATPTAYQPTYMLSAAPPQRYTHCFNHNPLYFEDPNLERCGVHCGCFTTVKSAACFFGNAVALPYLAVATPPRTCMPTLGDCPTCAEFDTDAYFREWQW